MPKDISEPSKRPADASQKLAQSLLTIWLNKEFFCAPFRNPFLFKIWGSPKVELTSGASTGEQFDSVINTEKIFIKKIAEDRYHLIFCDRTTGVHRRALIEDKPEEDKHAKEIKTRLIYFLKVKEKVGGSTIKYKPIRKAVLDAVEFYHGMISRKALDDLSNELNAALGEGVISYRNALVGKGNLDRHNSVLRDDLTRIAKLLVSNPKLADIILKSAGNPEVKRWYNEHPEAKAKRAERIESIKAHLPEWGEHVKFYLTVFNCTNDVELANLLAHPVQQPFREIKLLLQYGGKTDFNKVVTAVENERWQAAVAFLRPLHADQYDSEQGLKLLNVAFKSQGVGNSADSEALDKLVDLLSKNIPKKLIEEDMAKNNLAKLRNELSAWRSENCDSKVKAINTQVKKVNELIHLAELYLKDPKGKGKSPGSNFKFFTKELKLEDLLEKMNEQVVEIKMQEFKK